MKKIFGYLMLFNVAILFSNCKKEIMEYEGREGVYFAVQHGQPHLSINSWPYQPSSTVQFLAINKSEVDYGLKVAITGPVKDYDRTFRLEVNPDSTTAEMGKHYEAVKDTWILPAGQVTVNITVRLKRTTDLQTNEVKLGLRLVATKDFELSFPEWDALPQLTGGNVVKEFDASMHTLRINDIMVQPKIWSGSIQAGNRESGLLGVFSRRKMEFLEEHTGVKYEDFASEESMPTARMNLIFKDAEIVLIERYNAGNPVLEEDGRLMWLGTVPWTSYIGVPYVPAP
jgi:hypothetical protein